MTSGLQFIGDFVKKMVWHPLSLKLLSSLKLRPDTSVFALASFADIAIAVDDTKDRNICSLFIAGLSNDLRVSHRFARKYTLS